MRKKIVAGNWKMNLRLDEAESLVTGVCQLIENDQEAGKNRADQVIFFPPFVYLTRTMELIQDTQDTFAGAQNVHQEVKGAFTGEVSAPMVVSCGATHTLIGHSERRTLYHENDALLAQKVRVALDHDLIPVFCCGEQLPQREANEHFDTVKNQLYDGLFFLEQQDFSKVIIAYEPVWAIGTGKTASPAQAQEMHAFIRNLITEKYDAAVADNTTLLYGGSCNPGNAAELFSNPDVDGGLIGGASLKADDFFSIIKSF
ncbi:MAG: triose-phosphate isomerase [Bacteroidales bacterium]